MTSFREIISAGGRSTLGVLVGLQLLDSIDNALFNVFVPDIRESLSLSSAAIVIVAALAGVMVSVGALPLGVLGDRRRRTTIAGICTLAWAVSAVLLGLVQALWQLVLIRILAGIGKANEGPIQISILTDAYPPAGRGRVLGIHRSAQPLGIIAAPVLAAVFATTVPDGHEPWRWAFAALAVPGVILGIAATRLREPVRGRFEQEAPAARPASLRAAFTRLNRIRTFTSTMMALGAFGVCAIAVPIYLSIVLNDHLGQGLAARSVIGAVSSVGGLAGAALGGIFGDRLFRRSPTASLYLAAGALTALGLGFAVQAYSPDVATFVVVGTVTQGLTFAGIVSLGLVVASVTPVELRSTAFALVGLYLAVFGGLGGAVLTALAEQVWGARAAVAVVATAASITAGLVLIRGAGHLEQDIAQAGVPT